MQIIIKVSSYYAADLLGFDVLSLISGDDMLEMSALSKIACVSDQ